MWTHDDLYVVVEKEKEQCSIAIINFIEEFGRRFPS